jgi:small-conductance mechanosensitive channel
VITTTPLLALLIIGLTVAVGWGFYRLSTIELFERLRPYLLLGLIVSWGVAVAEAAFAVAYAITPHWVPLWLFVLGVIALTNLEWLRNLMAGLQVAFEGRFDTGDSVRIGDLEGEIIGLGLRATRVRGVDGQVHEVPNQRLTTDEVTDLAGEGDCACELTVTVPDHMPTERARRMARQAAALTPLASPRHSPEVFTETDDPAGGTIHLRIRGYAFDPTYQDHYRSDVTARLLQAFEQER